jgi:opacity protein-like surface antigen
MPAKTRVLTITLALVTLVTLVAQAALAADEDHSVAQTRRARGGGGVRVGAWQVQDLAEPPAPGSSSESVALEGWFQKGFDLHIALENTIGFWQRKQSATESGSLGSTTTTDVQTYLVPTLSTLKLYPATRPDSPVEPYLAAGLGVVLGIDREKVSSDDPLIVPGTNTTFHSGLGIQTGAGIEWNSGTAFGATIGGRYQWASFGEKVGGKALYRGPGFFGGLTYRFQYR